MTAVHKLKKNQFGDTLVEVMLATVIMSVVITACIVLVNRASRINQVSSERSEAANIIQSQAETLRLHRDSPDSNNPSSEWQQILSNEISGGSGNGNNNCSTYLNTGNGSLNSSNAFFFDPQTLDLQDFNAGFGPNFDNRYLVWIEGYRPTDANGNRDYVNFFIHSCWDGPGGAGPQQASLIYRLAL